MPFCSKCGTEVAEGINFCGKCGNALGSGQSTNPNPATTQTNYTASGGGGGTPFVLEKNMLFRIIGKLGYIFVIIGFCMPIACDKNGFDAADYLMDNNDAVFGLLMILMFITAVVGVIIGIVQLTNKKVNIAIDWTTTIVCIGSGLIVLGCLERDNIELQSGATMIIVGWIIAFIGQGLSSMIGGNRAESQAIPNIGQNLSSKIGGNRAESQAIPNIGQNLSSKIGGNGAESQAIPNIGQGLPSKIGGNNAKSLATPNREVYAVLKLVGAILMCIVLSLIAGAMFR